MGNALSGLGSILNISNAGLGSDLDQNTQFNLQIGLSQALSGIDTDRSLSNLLGNADAGPASAAKAADTLYQTYGNDPQATDAISNALRPYLNQDLNQSTTQLANAWFSRLDQGWAGGSSIDGGSKLPPFLG